MFGPRYFGGRYYGGRYFGAGAGGGGGGPVLTSAEQIGRVLVATAEVWDPDTSPNLRTLYWSTRGFTTLPGDTPGDTHFEELIASAGGVTRTLFDAGRTTGRSRVGFGEIILTNSADFGAEGELDDYIGYGFDGRDLELYFGDDPSSFPSDFVELLVGTMLPPEIGRTEVLVRVRDRQAELETPLQATLYDGDNVLPAGLEGSEELAEKPKPLTFGRVRNIEPVLVNSARLIYQVNDGSVSDIVDVYDRGVSLAVTPLDWNANTDLPSGPDQLRCAVFADATFLVVGADNGSTGAYAATSADGTSWSVESTNHTDTLFDCAYSEDEDVFCVVGAGGEISTWDGTTWSALRSVPFASGDTVYGVVWTGAKFVAVGEDVASAGISTSATGATWSAFKTAGVSAQLRAVAHGMGRTIAVGNGVATYSEDDGDTWTALNAPGGSAICNDIFYRGGTWVVATQSDGLYASINGGQSWESVYNPSNYNFYGVRYSEALGHWVALGEWVTGVDEHLIVISEDGYSWQRAFDGLTPISHARLDALAEDEDNGIVIAFGAEGDNASPAVAGTYASQADLLDDSLAPEAGTYKTYAAGGYFRLGSPPSGRITCDVTEGATTSDRTHGQLFAAVLDKAGFGSDYSTSDVNDLDSLFDAEAGIYLSDEVQVAEVLDRIARSAGAWWGVDRLGVFRIKRIIDPSGETAVATFDESQGDMTSALQRLKLEDPGEGLPFWRTQIRHRENYTVQRDDLAGAVSDARRAELVQRWLDAAATDTSVLTKHPLAPELVVETLIWDDTEASTEASRIQTLRGTRRDRFEFSVRMTNETVAVDLGDVVEIKSPRFGLSAGKNMLVIGVEPQPEDFTIRFNVWG